MTVIGFLIIFASTTLGSAGDRQENIRSRQIHIDLGASVRGILALYRSKRSNAFIAANIDPSP